MTNNPFDTRTEITSITDIWDIFKWRDGVSEDLLTKEYGADDVDLILWEVIVSDLFVEIMQWLLPYKKLKCEVITFVVPDFKEYREDDGDIECPFPKTTTEKTKSILRVTFPDGQYADFLPSGPHVVGQDYEDYLMEVVVGIGNRKLILVLTDENAKFKGAVYKNVETPLEFSKFNKNVLKDFLFANTPESSFIEE
jgi:hypothetical protein